MILAKFLFCSLLATALVYFTKFRGVGKKICRWALPPLPLAGYGSDPDPPSLFYTTITLSHGTNKKFKCETKNKLMSVIGQKHYKRV